MNSLSEDFGVGPMIRWSPSLYDPVQLLFNRYIFIFHKLLGQLANSLFIKWSKSTWQALGI